MSYLKKNSKLSITINVILPRKTVNQLELVRRAFERPTPELIASILEAGIQSEFDSRLAEIGVLPSLDAEPEASNPEMNDVKDGLLEMIKALRGQSTVDMRNLSEEENKNHLRNLCKNFDALKQDIEEIFQIAF